MPAQTPQHSATARLERWLNAVWYHQHTPTALARIGLGLLSGIYGALRWATQQRHRAQLAKQAPRQRPLVLVVGNLIAGGAGKTPVVMAVCKTMTSRGFQVGIISRGYGRTSSEIMVYTPNQPQQLDAAALGDEPLFLAQTTGCPIAVGVRRADAFQALLAMHPELDLVVSDDGLQHTRLERHVEWVVFDGRGAGNGRLLPAGPLREPLSRLNNVDAVLCTQGTVGELAARLHLNADAHWHAIAVRLNGFTQASTRLHRSVQEAVATWHDKTVTAFTGLGHPNKLFEAIEHSGIQLSVRMGLPDHTDYPENFCSTLPGDVLLTSGKDAVKLPTTDTRLWVVDIDVTLPTALLDSLEEQLGLTTD
ncbi:tetraacyldisaccharide 4'-kinase [Limnobacter humi]|uniref:Tetraacyldisaccharide 4'-kinase n=1 Tax=Limnobacter humi TaxID=1778671 RepID=A0ABT1WG95_9BURK|nr:tetraacyldisaccharide 4'-kinase [Limnobacter humi]MCQ8896536.1 tetraacyldisaccharide 4'-kinase [Limnobacter humi]